MTWSPPVDLDNCANEPIHTPGSIQPHGVLIAVTEPLLKVAVVSDNLAEWFGWNPSDAIGARLDVLIGEANSNSVARASEVDWIERHDDVSLTWNGRPLAATLFRSGRLLVVEIEVEDPLDTRASSLLRDASMALQSARSVVEVAKNAARWIRSLTGFDRVMVYRFDPHWNGEVIAENKVATLNTFLGLHYPSTDIPAQARELYRRNWLRVIPDIAYTPALLVSSPEAAAAGPLDLSGSRLRSVSPIHVEYLGNMGVGASMSVSILINGSLWGLIACHHYSGIHRPSLAARNAAEFLAQLISLRISETEWADSTERTIELSLTADRVTEAFASATRSSIDDILHDHEVEVLELAGAVGAAVMALGSMTRIGETPPEATIAAIVEQWTPGSEVFVTDRLGGMLDHGAKLQTELASGALAVALTSDHTDYAIWFRPEVIRSVDWGGDPHNAKLAQAEGANIRLSPRKSFDLWRETIRGTSAPWDASTINASERFARHLAGALLRRERDSAALALDLQSAMRPAQLPQIDGFELDAFYQTSDTGVVGGDWYDAFQIGEHMLAALIGDVAVHGLAAASEMTQLRNSLRAYLIDDPAPAAALERLDYLMAQALPGSIATVVCVVIDTRTSIMRISHAGHPPALWVGPAGSTYCPLDGDPLLGAHRATRTEQRVQLGPGDSIILYSDGLIERRNRSIDASLDRLRDEATALLGERDRRDPASELAVRMLSRGVHDDDVTILTIRLPSAD